MLAIAPALEGSPRRAAAEACAMDRQTLRGWVRRHDAEGLAGPPNRRLPGPRPRLSVDQEAAVAGLVRRGPDLAGHGVARRRRADLARAIAARSGVALAGRGVGDLLRRPGFRRPSTRPRHPAHDPGAQAAHKKASPRWSPRSCRGAPAGGRSSPGGRTRRGWASGAR